MNFRRKHTRGKHTRENSSEWRYPQTDKGSYKRGRVSAKRWAQKFPLVDRMFKIKYRP